MAKGKKRGDDQGDGAEGTPAQPSLTKSEAIRKAIENGNDRPSAGVKWIADTYGITVTPQMFSTVKNQSSKRQRKGGQVRNVGHGSTTDAVELARRVKELVKDYGADAVVAMATVLAE